ncbi:MAG: phage minor capsid protein [Paraclostridium sp.]
MKDYEKELKKLESIYSKAEQNLIQIITKKTVKNQSTDFYKSMLKEIQAELLRVQIASVKLSNSIVNKIYLEALEKALNSLQIDISSGFTALHKEAIQTITENLVQNFADVNNMVGRQIDDVLREIGLDKASNKFASGQTLKQMQKEVREKLLNENILGIVRKDGKIIPYTVYAELLCRSITAEAQNTSVLNVAKEYKKDLLKMSHHNSACEVCQKYEGKIYSISGKDERYPYLKSIPGFRKGYNNLHPRCRHSFSIFIEKYN